MQVTARVDYAVRALIELASLERTATRVELAGAQNIPGKFLEVILHDLTRAGILISHRGTRGGYGLARRPEEITIADVARAVDGPLAGVRGLPPEDLEYEGSARALRDVWVALRASIRVVLEGTTLADLVSGDLPPEIGLLLSEQGVWERR